MNKIDTVVADAIIKKANEQDTKKNFLNVMLVGMASEISKNCKYKCVDRSRHRVSKINVCANV